MGDELGDFQKEWRANILAKLTELSISQENLRQDFIEMKTSFTHVSQFKELEDKVNKLENFKSKLIGIILAINAVAFVLGWLINLYHGK